MEEIEEFRDIVGYEGLYQISNFGRVKSLSRYVKCRYGSFRLLKEIILIPRLNDRGYLYINLYKNHIKKTHKIHQLVVKRFICEYNIKTHVAEHKDNNRLNNKLTNLRIVSQRDNMNNLINQSKYGSGVVKTINSKFISRIEINGKRVHLGIYVDNTKASQKYLEVKQQIEEIEKITRNYDFKRTKRNEYFIEFFPIIVV